MYERVQQQQKRAGSRVPNLLARFWQMLLLFKMSDGKSAANIIIITLIRINLSAVNQLARSEKKIYNNYIKKWIDYIFTLHGA